MSQDEEPEFIPISRLNAYAYCPRRFYYEFALGEMVVNEHVFEGELLHERVDVPGTTTRDDKMQLRRVYLCAPKLGLAGYSDVLEAVGGKTDLPTLATNGQLYPVEYKKGKLGKWLSDHVQLCAQALALEESLAVPPATIKRGFVFYYGSARREEVTLDDTLRNRTLTLLAEAKLVATRTTPPPPISNRHKCRDCSLEPICLPREVLAFQQRKVKLNDGDTLSD